MLILALLVGLLGFICARTFRRSKPQRSRLTQAIYEHPRSLIRKGRHRAFQTIPAYLSYLRRAFGPREAVGSRTYIGKDVTNPKLIIKTDYRWKTFDDWANEIDYFANGLNLGIGDKVCIFAETQASWLMSALAVMKSGGVVTTAYATLGVEALIFSLKQTESRVMITTSNLYESVVKQVIPAVPSLQRIIFLDSNPSKISHDNLPIETYEALIQNGEVVASRDDWIEPDDLALIMYTSGTTGNPKGIMITHKQLCSAIYAMTNTLPMESNLKASDRVFSYLPLAHILELVMELSVLSKGGSIAYGELRTMTDDSCLNEKGQKCGDLSLAKPTLFAGVPKVYCRTYEAVNSQLAQQSQFKQKLFKVAYGLQRQLIMRGWGRSHLLDAFVFKPIQSKFGGNVRLFLSGGSALSSEVQEFLSVVAGPLIQGYGLTETCCTGTLGNPDDCLINTVGGPVIDNYIRLRDCPDLGYTFADPLGASGEIMISGPSLSSGYYKEPELTAEAFIRDPDTDQSWSLTEETKANVPEPGRTWFATGDIGRVMPDGTIKLIDRKKDLVKLCHGEYIALSNLESKYSESSMLDHICLVANSKLSKPVAIVVKKPGAIKDLILNDLQRLSKAYKMESFEQVDMIILVDGPWTIENKCLTDTMKLKRNEIYKRYADEIKAYT